MIGLLQRVREAFVEVEGQRIAEIGTGLLVFVGVEKGDSSIQAERLLKRLLGYRIFPDAQGPMNLSVTDTQGGLLLVPQFTLAADTNKGMRPSFTAAADAEAGRHWFEFLLEAAKCRLPQVASGKFGADMQVVLINDGPVTFWLQT